jgi:hypothetical protein
LNISALKPKQFGDHRHLDGRHDFTCLDAESGEVQNAVTFRIDERQANTGELGIG